MRKLFSPLFMALVLSLTCFVSPALAQSTTPVAYSSLPTLTAGQATSPAVDLNNRLYVTLTGTTVSVNNSVVVPAMPNGNSNGVPTVTTAASSSLARAFGGTLAELEVVSGASAGYVMVFDATSAPADGAVTPKLCYTLAANSTLAPTLSKMDTFNTGITVVFSTTGCFTKTASATAFISFNAP